MSAKPYKLLKFGDKALTLASRTVTFPLSEEVDETIDECINTLVSYNNHLSAEKR